MSNEKVEASVTNVEKYENPLPILNTDVEALEIETTDVHRGRLYIKNTGGGVLKGRIISRLKGLSFEPGEFEGNTVVNYAFNASAAGLGIGEAASSRFYVTSNGGEKEIPVFAKLTKMSVTTPDGYTIANIKDFYEYSLTHPTQARRLFIDSEFYMLLLATGYEYLEVYESLHKDANRERAMDNFFVLSGLKGRTGIEIVDDDTVEFSQTPNNKEIINGGFRVRKTDCGYVEAPLRLSEEAPWLSLSSGKLNAVDFDEANTATVNFQIDPAKIITNFARNKITVGTEALGKNTIEIVYRRLPELILRLNRETYRYADRGAIEVVNNTGANMQIETFCPESYVRFAARSFVVGARGEIPFEIKLSAFLNAQMLFRKMPYMKTAIELKIKIPGRLFKKTLPIIVGEW